MRRLIERILFVSALVIGLGAPASVRAQDASQDKPADEAQERPTGLPSPIKWTFNFDAGWGTFGFGNSLFNNPKEPGVEENLSDQWFEGYVKPAVSATYTLASSSEIYGKVSAVGERTYGSVPEPFGQDVSSFGPEDLSIGWRSGKSLTIGENALDFTVGRAQYRSGTASCCSTARRKAAAAAATGPTPARRSSSRRSGGSNRCPHRRSVLSRQGRTRRKRQRQPAVGHQLRVQHRRSDDARGHVHEVVRARGRQAGPRRPQRIQRARLHRSVPEQPDLSFEFEYASERNGDALDANAWTLQGSYELSTVGWKPKFTYRYAFFEGETRNHRQRKLRSAVPRLLRLGHLVAGRDRRRVFPVELAT